MMPRDSEKGTGAHRLTLRRPINHPCLLLCGLSHSVGSSQILLLSLPDNGFISLGSYPRWRVWELRVNAHTKEHSKTV